ncbi:aldo/keto reductase [Limosilactobacillus fastidiosus]|uniref:Aldo/keto reductase n=1 Tax=Limosilactobacillus fastidiosus TaxID=2759855 RepID=A0A7W3TYM8_9LACO|nr:aldo/keto reductase [Limosilactobacillus fastidiosus]MBB1063046.1 aldo/keto reductase [Limosilactobacillus fastidiosus]MBB1085701.1 aldo/keto reductase [Limosilactobacillus fastidiosus]MCD7083873.1 aldo/keto reductase [Limosilactobacillus fastidiosus]MCD7086180.1 aldo/keto reductase [Limosilactobacillus fastidiosus]MCD7114041.1 aldo/keto reductase [Limosilactobacillus fastidiosus]
MKKSVNLLTLADGQTMPQEGFGMYKITDQSTITSSIKYAYDAGYRLFDTAQLYKNEAEIGNALTELALPREELFITTKVSEPNQGYTQTIASVKDSLKKLQLDYVNLLLIHWPIERAFFDTWAALEELKKEGLTRSIGVSNYQMIHLQYLATQAHEMPVVNQIERHPHLNQLPLIKYDRAHQIVTQAWSPLGRGTILNNPLLEKIAKKHQKSSAQIVLRWQLQSGVAFIPKSIHEARIKQNIDIYNFQLSEQEINVINELHNFTRVGKEPALVYEYNLKY